ncbi:hypothetical protein AB3M83_08940 [Microbacterium sp. 179-B 1A2 NHS]|uniref:hypothetical protein n=1 Tax=Microbacterium sp. 179-B 1A2 NHS TaxID=3142383 RepID=UPI00399F0A08
MITDNDTRRTVRESAVKDCAMHDWCEVDHSHDQDAEDRAYHRRTVTAGAIEVAFVVSSGKPTVEWMPDFTEWTFAPDEACDLGALSESFQQIHAEFLAFIGANSRSGGRDREAIARIDSMTVSELRRACADAGLPMSSIGRVLDGDDTLARALAEACEPARELRRPIDVHDRMSGLGDL